MAVDQHKTKTAKTRRSCAFLGAVGCLAVIGALLGMIGAGAACGNKIETVKYMFGLGDMPRTLTRAMWDNAEAKRLGAEWIDPASCTNSTQFIQALWAKYHNGQVKCRYPDVWCVAVNPPDDDNFPVLFTANVDPIDLLHGQDMKAPIALTCPESMGEAFSMFPKRTLVVASRGGYVHAQSEPEVIRRSIFPHGNPKPNPDTYFLTPAGRVDCRPWDHAEAGEDAK